MLPTSPECVQLKLFLLTRRAGSQSKGCQGTSGESCGGNRFNLPSTLANWSPRFFLSPIPPNTGILLAILAVASH